MLFNRSGNDSTAIDELKKYVSFIYSSHRFKDLEMDVMLAEEDLIKIVGRETYQLADDFYHSSAYGSLNPSAEEKVLNLLVDHMRFPVALMAFHSYSSTNDVSHEKTGRKFKIDAEHEKIPFEWLLVRDEEAILNKAYKTTDRLIHWLDGQLSTDPINTIGETWGGSEAYKLSKQALVSSAEMFDSIFPIDKSRRFFITVLPFILENQRKMIAPVLTSEALDTLREKLMDNDLDQADRDLLELIRTPLVFFTMSTAVQRLAINLMPAGIFHEYFDTRIVNKLKHQYGLSARRELTSALREDAVQEMKYLEQHLAKLARDAAGEEYESPEINKIDPETKFVRL